MLHHVGMIWINENREYLKYDMDKQNSDWLTGGPWYNTYICKKLHGKLFEGFIRNARTDRYHIMCYIDAYENITNHLSVMMAAAVGVVHYQKFQLHKHYNCSVQP